MVQPFLGMQMIQAFWKKCSWFHRRTERQISLVLSSHYQNILQRNSDRQGSTASFLPFPAVTFPGNFKSTSFLHFYYPSLSFTASRVVPSDDFSSRLDVVAEGPDSQSATSP